MYIDVGVLVDSKSFSSVDVHTLCDTQIYIHTSTHA